MAPLLCTKHPCYLWHLSYVLSTPVIYGTSLMHLHIGSCCSCCVLAVLLCTSTCLMYCLCVGAPLPYWQLDTHHIILVRLQCTSTCLMYCLCVGAPLPYWQLDTHHIILVRLQCTSTCLMYCLCVGAPLPYWQLDTHHIILVRLQCTSTCLMYCLCVGAPLPYWQLDTHHIIHSKSPMYPHSFVCWYPGFPLMHLYPSIHPCYVLVWPQYSVPLYIRCVSGYRSNASASIHPSCVQLTPTVPAPIYIPRLHTGTLFVHTGSMHSLMCWYSTSVLHPCILCFCVVAPLYTFLMCAVTPPVYVHKSIIHPS